MCGIAGIIAAQGEESSREALTAMVDNLVHRGPDDRGIAQESRMGLAMQRLSIIGVANGRQPIASETGDETVVVNGEIYNYRTLRDELSRRGHDFRTDSDAEVAVHLYQEEGEQFVKRLRGMFALALWDRARQRLLLARDRTGQKPLYYAQGSDRFLFASEIKAIHATGLIAKELNEEAIRRYLAFGFVPGEETLFRSIRRVPPGHVLLLDSEGITLTRYWDIPRIEKNEVSMDAALLRVRELVEEAIDIRLVSEVPIGAFLSGGMDSSVVVGRMARELGSPVQTFAVGFGEIDDELPHARTVARHFNTIHHEVSIQGCTPDLLAEINWHYDEPASDPAAVPTFLLSRYAADHVTVALTGEGGDEVFAGYSHYHNMLRLGRLERRLPYFPRIARMLTGLESRFNDVGLQRLSKALWLASLSSRERARGMVTPFTDRDLDQLVLNSVNASNLGQIVDEVVGTWSDDSESLDRLLYFDAKTTLADQLLMKVDKMTMASSLEARSPLLDHVLIEYAATLPTGLKLSHLGSKLVLRRAFQGVLPDDILDRKKQGFDVPLVRWLGEDLKVLVDSLLLAESTLLSRFVKVEAVRSLWRQLERTASGRVARQLWRLLNLALWLDLHWGVRSDRPYLDDSTQRRRGALDPGIVRCQTHDFSHRSR